MWLTYFSPIIKLLCTNRPLWILIVWKERPWGCSKKLKGQTIFTNWETFVEGLLANFESILDVGPRLDIAKNITISFMIAFHMVQDNQNAALPMVQNYQKDLQEDI